MEFVLIKRAFFDNDGNCCSECNELIRKRDILHIYEELPDSLCVCIEIIGSNGEKRTIHEYHGSQYLTRNRIYNLQEILNK